MAHYLRGPAMAILDDDDAVEIEDVLAGHLAGALEDVQTCIPGVVLRADLARQRLAVRPTGGHASANPDTGERRYQRFAVIEEVPICYPQAGAYGITFPIAVGDEVLLVFASHSLDPWQQGRDGEEPRDPRRHHLTDAIAIPGVSRRARIAATSQALVVHAGDVRLGGPSATDRVARESDLEQLRTILTSAPDGLGYGSAVKSQLTSTSWPNCTSITRSL